MNALRHALLTALVTPTAFAAADADWPVESTLPKALGAAAGGGVQSNLVVTSTGRIISTYSEWSGTGGIQLYQTVSDDDGTTWSSPALLNPWRIPHPGQPRLWFHHRYQAVQHRQHRGAQPSF